MVVLRVPIPESINSEFSIICDFSFCCIIPKYDQWGFDIGGSSYKIVFLSAQLSDFICVSS